MATSAVAQPLAAAVPSSNTTEMNGTSSTISSPTYVPLSTTRRISSQSNPSHHTPAHQQPEVHSATINNTSKQASSGSSTTSTHHHPLYQPIDGVTLMIDNYDSFTYNVVQYLSELG